MVAERTESESRHFSMSSWLSPCSHTSVKFQKHLFNFDYNDYMTNGNMIGLCKMSVEQENEDIEPESRLEERHD